MTESGCNLVHAQGRSIMIDSPWRSRPLVQFRHPYPGLPVTFSKVGTSGRQQLQVFSAVLDLTFAFRVFASRVGDERQTLPGHCLDAEVRLTFPSVSKLWKP